MNEHVDFDDFDERVVPLQGWEERRGQRPPNALAARLDDRQTAERIAPHNIDAEQALLGAILINNDAYARVSGFLAPEHFMEDAHQQIFRVMASLISAQKLVTPITLKTYLGDADFGGQTVMQYLARLAADATTVINAAEYGRTVFDLAMRRRLITIGENLCTLAYEAPVDAHPLIQVETAEGALYEIKEAVIGGGSGTRRSPSATMAQAGDELTANIERALKGEAEVLPSTGVLNLDEELGGGLQPSFLLTIAGRPAMGKSAVGVEIARAVVRSGFAAAYHSLEMSRTQIMARLASSHMLDHSHKIPFSQLMRRRGISQYEAEAAIGAMHDLRNLPLTIEDTGRRTIGDIAISSERLANLYARKNLRLGAIVIDHAHLVKFSRVFKNEVDAYKEVADGALALAKHLDTCVVLLAQCNRGPETREDKRPSLADIRGAGAFEEDSDAVVFVYRPAYYVEKSAAYRNGEPGAEDELRACRHALELITDKNRAGRSNHVVRAWIDPALNAIRNLHYGA